MDSIECGNENIKSCVERIISECLAIKILTTSKSRDKIIENSILHRLEPLSDLKTVQLFFKKPE